MKILFLIRSLNSGGAERQLVVLSKGLRERGHDVVVAIFYSGGPLEKELSEARVRIRALNKRGRWDVFAFLSRVTKVIREERPAILHGYLDDPNLITTMLKSLFPRMRVVWGVRCSNIDNRDWLARLIFKLSCLLSRFPDAIIANPHVGRQHLVQADHETLSRTGATASLSLQKTSTPCLTQWEHSWTTPSSASIWVDEPGRSGIDSVSVPSWQCGSRSCRNCTKAIRESP